MHDVFTRMLIVLGLITTIGIGTTCGDAWLLSLRTVQWDSMVYKESSEYLSNPDCGWYEIYGYRIGDGKDYHKELENHYKACDKDIQLLMLQLNLGEYRNADISEEGLTEIEDILSYWERTNQYHIILRFLYDWDGHGETSEPDTIDQIMTHIKQVAPIVNNHKDAIFVWQGVLVGDVGEMHGSKYLDDTSLQSLMNVIAQCVDPKIYLAVRTPRHLRTILEGNEDIVGRLGLFNDGMLGSASDLGTYDNREEELEFQHQLCNTVPNGGEAVIDNSYNDCPSAYADLAIMHVSYLNHWHHDEVLNKWKNTVYQGDETVFVGCSAYDYIGTHLGYRYVLKDSDVVYNYKDETATLNIELENVGFAPAYRKYDIQLVLSNDNEPTTSLRLYDIDNRKWDAGEVTTVSLDIPLAEYTDGTYSIMFSMTDPTNGKQIMFGNDMEVHAAGYQLGHLTIDHLYGE